MTLALVAPLRAGLDSALDRCKALAAEWRGYPCQGREPTVCPPGCDRRQHPGCPARLAAVERRRERERREARLRASGAPSEAWPWILGVAPAVESPALRHVRAWHESPRPRPAVLILGHARGTGKTGACAWLLGEREGRFTTGAALLGIWPGSPEWRALVSAALLVCDDVEGGDGLSEADRAVVRGRFEALFRERHAAAGRETVLTTNLDRREGFPRWRPARVGVLLNGRSGGVPFAIWRDCGTRDLRRGLA